MTTENLDFPELWRVVQHNESGELYVVTGHLNRDTTRPDEFPKTVAYRSLGTGSEWCRPLEVFVTRFQITERKLTMDELVALTKAYHGTL